MSGGLASGAGKLSEHWMARRGRELGVAFYRPGMGMRSASAAERGAVLDGAGDEAGLRPATVRSDVGIATSQSSEASRMMRPAVGARLSRGLRRVAG